MKKHKIEIEQCDDSRVVLHVNGFSLDVTADADGIMWFLTRGVEVCSEGGFDWDEKHINEDQ